MPEDYCDMSWLKKTECAGPECLNHIPWWEQK
jgi:hypothetical protein